MKKLTCCVFGIAAASTLALSTAFADQVTITDCSGKTRLVKEIENGKENLLTLSFEKLGAKSLPDAVLQNVASGKKLASAKASDSTSLQFKNVGSGQWQYCSADGQMISVANVTLTELSGQETLSDATSIIGGGLAGLGALAAFTLGGGGNSDAPAPVAASRGPAITAGASNVSSARRPINSQSTGVCFIGEDTEVTPVSPFS